MWKAAGPPRLEYTGLSSQPDLVQIHPRQRRYPSLWSSGSFLERVGVRGEGYMCQVRSDCLSYHLDYHERPLRYRIDDGIVQASMDRARDMASGAKT